jgi:hypothetical protein
MRDTLLLVGFVVCVAIGIATVLWPQLSTHDAPVKPSTGAQSTLTK